LLHMSFCSGKAKTPEQKEAQDQSKKINGILEEHAKEQRKDLWIKLLLLGSGDAGKSTFTKQLAFIFGSTSQDYMTAFGPVLRDNSLEAMQLLLSDLKENSKLQEDIQEASAKVFEAKQLTPEIAIIIEKIIKKQKFIRTSRSS